MSSQYINREQVETLLRSLVSIKSPYFHEDEVMGFVNDWFNKNGLESRIHEFYEPLVTKFHGKNVVGVIDSGKPGPSIYLSGHLDTVNLCNGWTKPPFEGIVEGDYMYGVGALDMKAGVCAIMLATADFVKTHGKDFKGRIVFQMESDEEGPYGLGMVSLINDNVDHVADHSDFAIVCEPSAGFTDMLHPCICLGARGGYNYTINVTGKSAHAATPEKGINALVEASKIVCKLQDMAPMEDEKLGKGAMCVIGVNSSGGACSVPDYAEIEIFQHTVRGETQERIKEQAEKAIEQAGIEGKAEVKFRPSPCEGFDGGFVPYCIDEDDEYLQMLSDSVEDVTGTRPNYSYFQSIGDFNHVGGKLGIPTVLFGPDGENFHSSDERVNLKSTQEVSLSIREFLERVLV